MPGYCLSDETARPLDETARPLQVMVAMPEVGEEEGDPDVNTKTGAEKTFKNFNAAYEVL